MAYEDIQPNIENEENMGSVKVITLVPCIKTKGIYKIAWII